MNNTPVQPIKELSAELFLRYFEKTIFQPIREPKPRDLRGSGAGETIRGKFNREWMTKTNERFAIFFTANAFDYHRTEVCHECCHDRECTPTTRCDHPVDHLQKLTAVYADADVGKVGDEQAAEEIEVKKKALWTKLLAAPIAPNIIIVTKNGLQPLWLLTGDAIDPDTRATYKTVLKGVREWTKDAGAAGDKVYDIARILRMPGFYHKKAEAYMVKAYLVHEKRNALSDMTKAFPFFDEERIVYDNKSTQTLDSPINKIPIQDIALAALAKYGQPKAFFDNQGRINMAGRQTGAFVGKTGDVGNFIGSHSSELPSGNRITFVAKLLELSNKEAFKWICKEFKIPYAPPPIKTDPLAAPKEPIMIKKRDSSEVARKMVDPKYANGIPTGIKTFDRLTGGLKPQSMIGIAAATGNMKSLLAINICLNVATQGHPILYFDLENGVIRGERRLIQVYSGWTNEQMSHLIDDNRGASVVADTLTEIDAAIPFFREYDLGEVVNEKKYEKLIRTVAEYKKQNGLVCVVIDNVGCFPMEGEVGNDNDWKHELYTKFEEMAIAQDVAVIIVHHTSNKQEQNAGITKEDFDEQKGKRIVVPFLSKALGSSAFGNKLAVGMTIAHDAENQRLLCWIQKNRDQEADKKFAVYTNKDSIRITNEPIDPLNFRPKIFPLDDPKYVQTSTKDIVERRADAEAANLKMLKEFAKPASSVTVEVAEANLVCSTCGTTTFYPPKENGSSLCENMHEIAPQKELTKP